MSVVSNYPCLIISRSDSMDNTRVLIATPQLHLCRQAKITHDDQGVELELMTVHRGKHACITRQGDTFTLANLGREHSLRIYEKELKPGMSHDLHHGNTFLIPDPAAFPPGELYYSIMFLSDPDMTAKATFFLNESLGRVYVLGKQIKLEPKTYDVLRYLYANRPNVCARHDIIAAVWPELAGQPELIALQEPALNTHLGNIRREIKGATENRFTFMEHVHGQGYRLLI